MPDIEQQQQLIEQIAQELYTAMPEGCVSATVRFRVVADLGQLEATGTREDGGTERVGRFSDAFTAALTQLRHAMYTDGTGTWFSGEITVTYEGTVRSDFNYDDEPAWTRELDASQWAKDLERFPRRPEVVPKWLEAKLATAVAARAE